MKNLKLFLLGLMLCAALPSQAWDRTRHDAIAYIAECNLTPRAKRNIARYLDHSIVYYASWMDKYRDTPEFRNVEHVSYVDADMQLVDTLRKGKTNCVVELMHAIDRLKDYRNMSDSLVRLNLMYVIHIVGDMHCPSHVKYPGCKSGRADLNGKKMSYHAMWDWGVLDGAHGWSYSEYRLLLDTFSSLTESRVLILLLLNLLFLIIGMLMEANAAIIMMTPILMPLLTLYGINPLMFGIVMSFNLCIGLVGVGLCLLLSNQIGETSLTKSLKALMPMLLISICVLLLITYVDPLTTWLPSLLKK